VVYDAALTLEMPARLSALSGLNALAHCVDSLWAPRADPIATALALEGARALDAGLRRVHDDPHDVEGREQTLYGSYLAAVSFAAAGSGLHHKICHVLGGRYDLPHAPTHAVVLPYVLALNAPAAPDADARIAQAFGTETGLEGLQALRSRLDAPRALRDYGFEEDQIPDAVKAILPSVPESNPATVTPENLERLLQSAWEGAEPR
jgi:maleylacetate reductase